jgi:hypothetical protein
VRVSSAWVPADCRREGLMRENVVRIERTFFSVCTKGRRSFIIDITAGLISQSKIPI